MYSASKIKYNGEILSRDNLMLQNVTKLNDCWRRAVAKEPFNYIKQHITFDPDQLESMGKKITQDGEGLPQGENTYDFNMLNKT